MSPPWGEQGLCRGTNGSHMLLIQMFTFIKPITDAALSPQDLLLRFQYSNTHTHRLQTSCGGKGMARPLSQEESASECLGRPLPQGGSAKSLALTSFYWFSRLLTSKKVLFYYTKVCFGWLSFADTGEGVTEYIKGGHLQCKRRNGQNGQNGFVPYLEGLAQILGR